MRTVKVKIQRTEITFYKPEEKVVGTILVNGKLTNAECKREIEVDFKFISKEVITEEEAAEKGENAKVEEVADSNGFKAVRVTFDSGILFATNKSDLNQKSKTELAKFSTVLNNNTDCHVDIYGHTDSTGNDGINIPLSNSRAQSVATYLKSCGVSAAQLQTIAGKGSSDPVADNSTAAGRQQNRRVEVYMYASQAMVDAANAGTLK